MRISYDLLAELATDGDQDAIETLGAWAGVDENPSAPTSQVQAHFNRNPEGFLLSGGPFSFGPPEASSQEVGDGDILDDEED